MKKYFFLVVLILCFRGYSQSDAGVYLDSGASKYGEGNYSEALVLFEKCALLCKKNGNQMLLGKAYNDIGNASSQLGHSEKALKYYQLAVGISTNLKDSLTIAKTTKNIGALYAEQKDFATAMDYYLSARNLAEKIHNKPLIADCLNNMGIVYEQQLNYPKAVQVYQKALAIYKVQKDQQRTAMTLNNLAIVYKYVKDYANSIRNYEAALNLAEKLNEQFTVAATQNNLGNVYALTGDYSKSLALCLLANENGKKVQAQEIIVESYDGIATAYEKLKQFPRAIAFRKLYEKEKERFINTERSGQLAEMQVKYEAVKKQGQITSLTQEGTLRKLQIKEQQLQIQNRNYMIAGFLVMLAILIVISFLWYRQQQFKNQLEKEKTIRETEEQERLRIAKDIHDDLGSGLSKINFLSELIFQKTEQLPDIRSNSESVKETASKMIDNMRDLIWALNPDNTTLPNLIARIREYTTDYLEDFPIEVYYSFPSNFPNKAITKESHREVFMVVKETINNIAKHSKATQVKMEVSFTADKMQLMIKDNGSGFNMEECTVGNGLRNIKSRLAAIGGECSISTAKNNGTIVEVHVSLQKILR